jgi:hypothetical protein
MFYFLIVANGLRLCEVGDLEAQSFNLAQMYVKSTNVEVGTSAPISQNRC